MTVSHPIEIATGAARASRRLVAQPRDALLSALLFALVTGAWLAFFLFVPLDFTPPRPR